MKTLSKLAIITVISSLCNSGYAGEIIFNDQANMKISRLITKARILKNTRGKDLVTTNPETQAQEGVESIGQVGCGAIDIANQAPPRIGRAPRVTEVYILGDVISAGNKCQ